MMMMIIGFSLTVTGLDWFGTRYYDSVIHHHPMKNISLKKLKKINRNGIFTNHKHTQQFPERKAKPPVKPSSTILSSTIDHRPNLKA